jgi:hypothetical protein
MHVVFNATEVQLFKWHKNSPEKIDYTHEANICLALPTWAHISGRQTPCSTRGLPPPFYIINAGGKPRVKLGV